MTIELKPEHQRLIERAVESGIYENQDEVIAQALELIRTQLGSEDWMNERREELASQIANGFAQAERGELVDGEEALRRLRERRGAKPEM